MFPEHRELISELRQSHPRFQRIFDQHNELDHAIKNMEDGRLPGSKLELGQLKKKKLKLKDDLYSIIKQKRDD